MCLTFMNYLDIAKCLHSAVVQSANLQITHQQWRSLQHATMRIYFRFAASILSLVWLLINLIISAPFQSLKGSFLASITKLFTVSSLSSQHGMDLLNYAYTLNRHFQPLKPPPPASDAPYGLFCHKHVRNMIHVIYLQRQQQEGVERQLWLKRRQNYKRKGRQGRNQLPFVNGSST